MGRLIQLLGGTVGLVAEATTHQINKNASSQRPKQNGSENNRDQYHTDRNYADSGRNYADNDRNYANINYNYANNNRNYVNNDRNYIDNDRNYADDEYWTNEKADEKPPEYEEISHNDAFTSQRSYGFPETQPSRVEMFPPHTFDSNHSRSGPLPLPIIIPQRRPENKSRGWAYVYAPCLASCGIEEDAFANFILSFNKACQASPALDAVNLAAFGVGFAPGIAPMVVSTVVPMAVNAAKNAQTNTQASTYLAKANAELFEPRGLMAMMTTFNNNQSSQMISYNTSGLDQGPSNGAASNTGDFVLPPSAPLTSFQRDELAGFGSSSGGQMQRVGHFMGDYFDRRAQYGYAQGHAGYAGDGANSPQFTSRWSDPSNSGSLLGIVSGGLIQRPPDTRREEKRLRKQKEKQSRRPGLIGMAKGAAFGPDNRDQGLIKGLKSKTAGKQELLYLMIVNKDDGARTPS